MKVFVSSKEEVDVTIKNCNAVALLSINDLGTTTIQHSLPASNHLQLNMEDVLDKKELGAPTKKQVEAAIRWARGWKDHVIVVNCHAGVSRSTAFAAAILADNFGVDEAIKQLVEVRPHACPNPVISKMADDFLGLNGKLFEACEKVAFEHMSSVFGD